MQLLVPNHAFVELGGRRSHSSSAGISICAGTIAVEPNSIRGTWRVRLVGTADLASLGTCHPAYLFLNRINWGIRPTGDPGTTDAGFPQSGVCDFRWYSCGHHLNAPALSLLRLFGRCKDAPGSADRAVSDAHILPARRDTRRENART